MENFREEGPDALAESHHLNPPGLHRGIRNLALQDILDQLCSASQFLENLQDPVSEDDFFSFGIKRSLIEENLFRLGNVNDNTFPDTLSPIEQCCRVAALLYVQTALAKVNCKVYHDLCSSIRYNIEQISLEDLQMHHPDLFLWILFVGGGAAPFNTDRLWFMRAIGKSLHTALWEEVEQRLQGWPWRPKYCVPWRAIWREAITKEAEL